MPSLVIAPLEPDRHLGSLLALAKEFESAEHHRPLADHRWLDLTKSQAGDGHILVALDGEVMVGLLHTETSKRAVELELVVRPSASFEEVAPDLLAAGVALVHSSRRERAVLWIPNPSAARDRLLGGLGWQADREVLQLRRPLPLEPDLVVPAPPLRTFRPGVDEAPWLELNNRAFDWHPDQGDWELATLLEREREPWFDPEGFLMLEEAGTLLGFCWTKVHAEPPAGEIYVIAVDPRASGRGLGAALLTAGLAHLHDHRGMREAILYVEATNAPARALYDRYRFVHDHTDRRYRLELEPDDPPHPR